MAKAYKEITIWEDGNENINHTYLLEGDMMIGYIRSQSDVAHYFKNPIRISKSRRKFELVEPNPFDTARAPDTGTVKPIENIQEITGSKGNVYYLDKDNLTCTCPGFTYRGTCKHTKELANEVPNT